MGVYSNSRYDYDEDLADIDMSSLQEAFLIDDLTHNYSEEDIKNFCESGAVDALLEVGVLKNKRTIVRLNKSSDLHRREVISAIQIAKQKNDPLVDKLLKYKALFKQAKAKITEKYGHQAARVAVKGQKEYIHTMKHVNLSNSKNGSMLTNDPNR